MYKNKTTLLVYNINEERVILCEMNQKYILNLSMKYQYILEYLHEIQDDGISRVTHMEIETNFGIRQTLVSKCLIRLERSDKCVKKISLGVYRVNYINISRYTPLNKVIRYCNETIKNYELVNLKYEEQARKLDMAVDEIKII